MILHVHDLAVKANIGDVLVATPDQKIIDLIKNYGGQAIMTKKNHSTGTDRVYEVFENYLQKKPEIVINLQGDMPNLNPLTIKMLVEYMKNKLCDVGTLASSLDQEKEKKDPNVCKVVTKKDIIQSKFDTAIDFYRLSKELSTDFIYHHIGIYAFTNKALIRYVSLKRSKLEIERKLEQLRALENGMKIHVGYIDNCPLSVDTDKDLFEIKKMMES